MRFKHSAVCGIVALALLGTAPASWADVVWQVSGGKLTGATGVDVGGTLYDVQFVDGTCISLFGGCDQASDFTFQTQAGALAAAQALMDQVFQDVAQGQFDTDVDLTQGCDHIPGVNFPVCDVFTPWALVGLLASTGVAVNQPVEANDLVLPGSITPSTDTSGNTVSALNSVWAVWSPHAATVPEPGTMALTGLALAGLGLARRRQPKAG